MYTTRRYTVNGSTDTNTTYDGVSRYRYREKTWVNTPDYRARRASGTLPMNPFSYLDQQGALVPSVMSRSFKLYDVNRQIEWSTDFVYTPTLMGSVPKSLVSLASMRAVKQAEGAKVNAPVFLAELNKTSAMVASTARTLVYTYLALKKGQFDEAGKNLGMLIPKKQVVSWRREYGVAPKKAASNAWLQMQYGWVPLLSEVRNAVHALGDMTDAPAGRRLVFKGRASSDDKTSEVNRILFRKETGSYEIKGTIERNFAYSARCTWTAEANQADIPAKLGLLNPAEVIWELVPLSFVVDWFLPIGDYLSAFSTVASWDSKSCVIGEKVVQLDGVFPTSRYPKDSQVSGFTANTQLVSVKRYPVNRPPWSISLKFPTSVPQAVSAIALLAQKLR